MDCSDNFIWQIWCYTINEGAKQLELRCGVQLKKEQGPRHIVFHPRVPVAYIINELKSTVSVLKCNLRVLEDSDYSQEMDSNSNESVLRHIQTLRCLPSDFESHDHHRSHASEIRLHPDGKHVFVANRGHDSIAIFSIDEEREGLLTLVSITSSGGVFPRNFNFDSTGNFVVVGNQNSNDLCVFAFHKENGSLTPVDKVFQPSPNFVFSIPRREAKSPETRKDTGKEKFPFSREVQNQKTVNAFKLRHAALLGLFLGFWLCLGL